MKKAKRRHELELKFCLDSATAEAVARHPLLADLPSARSRQQDIYFDTPESRIKAKGCSLRVRKSGEIYLQTLKTRGAHVGLFRRREWDIEIPAMRPDVRTLLKIPLRQLKLVDADLLAKVCCDIERRSWLVEVGETLIEVALDIGTISTLDRSSDIIELELELRRGEAAAVFALARRLSKTLPLRLGALSKIERGERLALGRQGSEKASALDLKDSMSVAEVSASVVLSTINHFRLNEDAMLVTGHSEALHQARVAVRRLRGALSLFRPALRADPLAQSRKDLRWLASALAEARDLDVFIAAHPTMPRAKRRTIEAARAAAYEEAREALDSPRVRLLLLDLVEGVTIGNWFKSAASRPIPPFARRRLDAQWRHVGHAVELATLNVDDRHRLRIQCKKMRYAVDFLQTLYGKKARRMEMQLGAIQDGLGRLNDWVVHQQIRTRLSLRIAEDAASEESHRRDIREVEAHFKKLHKIGRFWA